MAQQPTINDLFQDLLTLRGEWDALCTNPKLRFEKEVEWVVQSCDKNDTARKYALGDFEAVRVALRNIAAVGVTIDPARKLAYVLPRDSKMVYDLSYMGLIDIAIESGSIRWAQARRVHMNDTFELAGFDAPPVHKCKPFDKPEARGEVLGAYVVVKTIDGDYLTNTMHIDDINAIRARSPAWKNGQKGPWKTDEAEMQKKTVVKNAYKYWPRSERLDKAVHYLNTDGGQGIDLTPEDEGNSILQPLLDEVAKAATGDAVAAVWKRGRVALQEHPEHTAKLREAVAKKNRELGVAPPTNGATTATAAPTPAPTPAPSAPGAPRTYAQVIEFIKTVETDEALIEAGNMIDRLPADQQGDANRFYNERLAYLDKKLGRAA